MFDLLHSKTTRALFLIFSGEKRQSSSQELDELLETPNKKKKQKKKNR